MSIGLDESGGDVVQMIEAGYSPMRFPGATTVQVRGLGDIWQDLTGAINTGLSVFDTVSGAKAQREMQAAQVELERLRAEQAKEAAGTQTTTLLVVGGLAAAALIAVVFTTR